MKCRQAGLGIAWKALDLSESWAASDRPGMKGTESALTKEVDTEEWGLWDAHLFLTVWLVGHLGRLLQIETLTSCHTPMLPVPIHQQDPGCL